MTNLPPGPTDLRRRGVCALAAVASGVVLNRAVAAGLDPRWVFLGSIAVFGLAHGACDLWLPGWVRSRRTTAAFAGHFCVGYLALALAVLPMWHWLPGGALSGFLCLTAWHWGSADAVLTATRSWRFGALAVGRGLMVMAAPSAFHPQAALRVLGALATGLDACLTPPHLQWLAAVAMAIGVGMQFAALPMRPASRAGPGHHLETLFLLGLFASFDLLVSTTLYFVWFHAWRHILRLGHWQSPGERNLFILLGRFHWAALPCMLGALGLLWLVAWIWPGDLLRAYLVLLSAVTVPHAALVVWLDRVERARAAFGRSEFDDGSGKPSAVLVR